MMVHKLAIYMTDQIIKNNSELASEREIYVYAIETLLLQASVYLPLIIVSLYLKILFPMLIFLFFLIFLRGQTSGYHSNSAFSCFIFSILTSIGNVWFSLEYLNDSLSLVFVLLVVSSLYIYKQAPINHVNLNLTNYEAKYMKKKTFRIMVVELILIVFFAFFQTTQWISVIGSVAIINVAAYMLLAKIFGQEVKKDAEVL